LVVTSGKKVSEQILKIFVPDKNNSQRVHALDYPQALLFRTKCSLRRLGALSRNLKQFEKVSTHSSFQLLIAYEKTRKQRSSRKERRRMDDVKPSDYDFRACLHPTTQTKFQQFK